MDKARKEIVSAALVRYNKSGYPLFRRISGEHPAVIALCKLDFDACSLRDVILCFYENPIKSGGIVQKLFHEILVHVYQQQRSVKRAGLKPEWLDNTLLYLYDTRIFTEQNLDAVLNIFSIHQFAKEIEIMYEGHVLTKPNFEDICHRFSMSENNIKIEVREFSDLYVAIERADFQLTVEIRKQVLTCKQPKECAALINFFASENLLDSDYLHWLLNFEKSGALLDSVLELGYHDCFSIENINIITRYSDVSMAARCLIRLFSNNNYSVLNLDVAMSNKEPFCAANVINLLNDRLTPAVLEKIKNYENLSSLFEVLKVLDRANLLIEDNISIVFEDQYSALGLVDISWADFPEAVFTQEVFDSIIRYVGTIALDGLSNVVVAYLKRVTDEMYELHGYYHRNRGFGQLQTFFNPDQRVDGLLATMERDFNHAQSVHEVSVEKTVSESATRLKDRYGKNIKSKIALLEIIKEIKKYVNALPVGLKNNAAKQCISVVTQDSWNYTEKNSGVTTHQLLGLVWLAIHDHDNRIGELEDALVQFVEGLYEIERGYNISVEGVDRGGKNLRICVHGAFNKIIEKLDGIHPDVAINYVTIVNATWKLKSVVSQELKAYLEDYKVSHSDSEFREKLEVIKQKGIEIIWNEISSRVAGRMFEEYGEYVFGGQRDEKFDEFIDMGKYFNVENLDEYKEKCSPSPERFFSTVAKNESDSCPDNQLKIA